MPVSTVVAHLTLVDADRAAAGITRLGVQRLEARTAVRTRRTHDIPLTSKMFLTFETLEMTHVPALSLSLRALVREYYLNTTHDHIFRTAQVVVGALCLLLSYRRIFFSFHSTQYT